jgi:hypothetical protein
VEVGAIWSHINTIVRPREALRAILVDPINNLSESQNYKNEQGEVNKRTVDE